MGAGGNIEIHLKSSRIYLAEERVQSLARLNFDHQPGVVVMDGEFLH